MKKNQAKTPAPAHDLAALIAELLLLTPEARRMVLARAQEIKAQVVA